MASIRFRAGTWQARVKKAGFEEVVRSFSNKKDALEWARAVESTMEQGTYRSTAVARQMSLSDVIERFIGQVLPRMKGYKEDQFRLKAIQRRPIGKCPMSELSVSRMAAYRDSRLKEVTGGTVVRELAYLSSIINHARREWGLNIENPVALVRKPAAAQSRSRTLSPAERTRLLQALQPHPGMSVWTLPIVELALATGMRRGELLAIRWTDVKVDRRTIHIKTSKNGEARTVPLSSRAVEVIESIPSSGSDVVFPVEHPALTKCFGRALARAGIADFRFHDLRHTAITELAKKLPNLIELSAVSGHKSLKMLQRYYHPDAELLAAKLG